MAHLLYRASTAPTVPATTSAKNAPLTNLEVDGNFKSLNDHLVSLEQQVTNIETGDITLQNATLSGDVVIDSTSALTLPVGTTTQRPDPATPGLIRYNSDLSMFEGYVGTAWSPVGGASISDDTTTDDTYYPSMTTSTSGAATSLQVSSTKLTFNPYSGTLTATNVNSTSDITQKTNIEPIANATEVVGQLEGVTFQWKDSGKGSAGVVAQQIEQVIPDLVETGADGIKSVNYSGLIAYLIEANKQLVARIEKLESDK